MGSFADSLSERSKHTKIVNGYCLICGAHGRLSQDHVPPQGSITVTKTEQFHLTEKLDLRAPKIKGVRSPNGSKFRTICRHCNMTALGRNDEEVSRICQTLTKKISHFFQYANSLVSIVLTSVNALKYKRAMVGHILSATSVTECTKPPQSTPYFDPLKDFVLGNDKAMDDTHDVYYWFFPHRYHQSIKIFSVRNASHECCMSLLAFYPLAFLVTEKGKGIYPAGAVKLENNDKDLFVNLSQQNANFSSFPAVALEDDQTVAFVNNMSIVSYPIHN